MSPSPCSAPGPSPRAARPRPAARAPWALAIGAAALCWSGAAAAAPCAAKAAGSELSQAITDMDVAFGELDEAGFRRARSHRGQLLPCLGEQLSPAQVTAVHRSEALASFLDRQPAAAVGAMRALLAVAPGYSFTEEIAPIGHPLHIYYEIALGSPTVAGRALPRPAGGWIEVDGVATELAPPDRPYLFQRMDRDGQVLQTELVMAGAEPTPYVSRDGKALKADKAPKDRDERRLQVQLLATSGVAALACGGLYLAGTQTNSAFWNPSTEAADLAALRDQTNTLGWLSAGAGAVAISTGAAGLLVGRW